MNTVEYIASGILEQYVSGTATSQERREVECMSHIYPEIHEELVAMQEALEALAMAEAVAPPAHVKASFMDAIKALKEEEEAANVTVTAVEQNTTSEAPIRPETKVVEMSVKENLGTKQNEVKAITVASKPYGFMRVAASLLFLLSAGLAYLLYQNSSEKRNLQNEIAGVLDNNRSQQATIKAKELQLSIAENKEFALVNMAGIPAKSPTSNANIYWNKKTAEVFVAVKNLPKPAADKQYQLWAIADGKPVDLGMIEGEDLSVVFQKMKTIKNPQAFAVTLEVKGGVASPTMSEMYVMGAI
jgi:anti-sigma-K factor RskA